MWLRSTWYDIDWTLDMTLVGQSFDRNGDFYRREEDGSSFAPDPLGGPGLVSTLSLLHKLFFFFFFLPKTRTRKKLVVKS